MGNCATKPMALDDAPLPLEKPPSMHGSSVDGYAYKEEEEAAATTNRTSPEREPLLKSKEVEESNKNDTSEAQKDVELKNAENVVLETHTLASEPAEGKKEVMHHEITDEATPANPDQGTVIAPQALTKDDDQVQIEDKDAAFAKPKDPEAITIGTPQENAASVEPEDSKAKVQVEAQDIDAVVKEPKDKAATIVASPQENPAPLETQENDDEVTKPKDNEATVTATNAEPVESSATKAPKEKKKGDVFHTLFTMYNNMVKKP